MRKCVSYSLFKVLVYVFLRFKIPNNLFSFFIYHPTLGFLTYGDSKKNDLLPGRPAVASTYNRYVGLQFLLLLTYSK